jgi:hypothetical protein
MKRKESSGSDDKVPFRWPGRALISFAVLLATLSCSERIDWDLEYIEEDLLVVEGKITNEAGPHEVRLSRPVFEMNGNPEPVTGARVTIADNRRVVQSLEEDLRRPGVYLTEPGFTAAVNRGYQLRIEFRDRTYTAVTFMRPVSDFQNMRHVRVQDDPPLFELYIGDSPQPAIIRVELDWSHVRGYDTLPDSENHALIYHYSLGGVDVNRIFAPESERVRFPPGTVIIREKESVTPVYEEYLRGMLAETDWRGGVFDVLPGNARTNLSEGALGYFTAATVIRDTIRVPLLP